MGTAKERRPFSAHNYQINNSRTSTAASTALEVGGVVSLESTSTAAPVVYTLARLLDAGELMAVHVTAVGSSSDGGGQMHVNAASGQFFGSSSEDMLTLATSGDGALLVGVSTARIGVVGNNGGTFSTST